jgi:hypothetical protein
MGSLTRRQMIILGMMVLVVFYGLYSLLGASRTKKMTGDVTARSSELKTFIGTVVTAMGKDSLTPLDVYMISKAKAEWQSNPFIERGSFKDWQRLKETGKGQGAGTRKVTFSYTGYIEAGKRKIAIINGVEYGVGEPLDVEGYVLKAVLPSRIVIENKTDKTSFDIPFQE